MVRAPYFDKNGVKKGAWSQEEDDKLRAYVLRYGHWNWRELPRFAGLSRCGKSCRLRWLNYLRPDVKRGGYTKEEEDLIIKLHEQLGNKWAKIAAELPGRTDNEIKNHWHTYLKKRSKKREEKSEMKEQSSSEETSETDINKNTEAGKAETTAEANATFHPILESSKLSPQEISSNELSCLCSVAVPAEVEVLPPGTKWTAESCLAAYEEDFWTAPFVPDDSCYYHDGCLSTFFQEGGCFASSYELYCDQAWAFSIN